MSNATCGHQCEAISPHTATTPANTATSNHTCASCTCSIAVDHALGWNKTVVRGWPETSESTSGIIAMPTSASPADAHAPVRAAMWPSTVSSAPLRSQPFGTSPFKSSPASLGGIKNAENKNDPTASADNIHPAPRNAGKPKVVGTPGSGMPSAANDSPTKAWETVPASTPASTIMAK